MGSKRNNSNTCFAYHAYRFVALKNIIFDYNLNSYFVTMMLLRDIGTWNTMSEQEEKGNVQ